MSDVMLYQGPNGGDLVFENGLVSMDESPFTAIYMSLFGGNLEDNGTTATESEQWWANFDEPDLTRHLRSRTQAILIGLPAISSNLIRVEEAAQQDLEWLKQDLADDIHVTASIPARNTVKIVVEVKGRSGTAYNFTFDRNWGPSS